MEPVRIAVLPLNDAKSLQDDLAKDNIELILNHNDQTCTRGCTVTVEVLAYEKDLPKIIEMYHHNYKKLTEGHQVDWEVANSIYDPTQSHATCPACGTSFSTGFKECPDCGLSFG